MEYKDYYKILGVEKTATQDEIKKTYRKIAKKNHPDAKPGDKKSEERFKEANEAYEVLGDVDKRKKYDELGQNHNFSHGSNFDPSQYGFGNNVRYEYSSGSGGDSFSDFFNMFFGGGGDIFGQSGASAGTGGRSRFSRSYATKGEDIEAEIEIFPEEGFNGVEKTVSLKTSKTDRKITFNIPEGIKDGEKIKLSGQGSPGANGGKNGDLYLKIKLKKGTYELDGMNLLATLDLTPWQAALGSEVSANTLDGKILVKVPPGIQSDNRIRVANKGYKDSKKNRGDLYFRIRIMNPHKLSKEQKELYEKLSKIE